MIMKKDLRKAAKAVAAAGRHGDTELVHLSKAEKALLALALGAGTINPATGLEEHFNFFDPLGITDNVVNFVDKVDPVFHALHPALAKLPGSPDAFLEAASMKDSGNPYGPTASAFDVAGGGTSWSQDPEKRKYGRMAGTAIASFFGGQALAGMGGSGASAGSGAYSGIADGGMSTYQLGAGASPELLGGTGVGAGGLYSTASGNMSTYQLGADSAPELLGPGASSGSLYDTANALYEIPADVGAGYNTAYGNMGPGASGNPGFFSNLMQEYGVNGTPGESYLQRLLRLAKGAGKLYNVGSGVMGLYQANQMRQLGKPGQAAAKRMAYLEANPEAIQGLPGYAAGKASMIQARDRMLAQQGQLGGGAALEATMKSEGAYDAQVRGAEMGRLQSVAQGGVGAQANYAELVSRALASIGYTFGPQNPPRRA